MCLGIWPSSLSAHNPVLFSSKSYPDEVQENDTSTSCRFRELYSTGTHTCLRRLTAIRTTSIHLAQSRRISADIDKSSSVSVVAVDPGELATIHSCDALNVNIAFTLLTTIAAAAIQLAVILDIVVDDVDSAAAIVLNHFVSGVVSASTYDPGFLPSDVILDSDGIFADVFEPDELEGARPIAMDTFSLVGSNDDILESRTRAEKKNSIGITCVSESVC